jgi:hypothetical protein
MQEVLTVLRNLQSAISTSRIELSQNLKTAVLDVQRVHQCSIKSCHSVNLNENFEFACTGGHGNTLGIMLIKMAADDSNGEGHEAVLKIVDSLVVPSAHAAAVTGVHLAVMDQKEGIFYLRLASVGRTSASNSGL